MPSYHVAHVLMKVHDAVTIDAKNIIMHSLVKIGLDDWLKKIIMHSFSVKIELDDRAEGCPFFPSLSVP